MRVTANDDPEEIVADVPKRFSSLIIDLPVQQSGTGDPSPTNIRNIGQWTDVELYVADDTTETTPTTTIQLETPLYGGMVDVARGEVCSTYNSKHSSSSWEMVEAGQFRCSVSAYNNGDETSTNVADLYSTHYKTVSNKDAYDATDDLTCGLATIEGTTYLYVNDLDYDTLEAFTAYIGDVLFVFKAHIPMSDTIEPTIVYLPEGTSYVWATAGWAEVTLSLTAFAPPVSVDCIQKSHVTSCAVSFEPQQDLHGYDSPWPDGGGKNLWNPHLYSGGSYNPTVGAQWTLTDSQVQFTTNANASVYTVTMSSAWTSYTMVFPITRGNTYKLTATIASTGQLGTSIGYLDSNYEVIQASSDTTTPQTWDYTRSPSASGTAEYYFIVITNCDSATATITLTEPQFELGSSKTSFAPYSNLCPITGWTGCAVYAEESYDPTADPKASVNFGRTSYGGTADVVLGSGSEGWTTFTLNGTQTRNAQKLDGAYNAVARWDLPVPAKAFTPGVPPYLCESLRAVSSSLIGSFQSWSDSESHAYTFTFSDNGQRVGIAIPKSVGISTAAELDTWLSNNPITFCYEVSTPTPFTFPPDTLDLQKGDNECWAEMTNTDTQNSTP